MGKTTMVGGAVASTLMAAMMAFALPATAQEAQRTATSAGAVANGAKLHLQWELQRPVADCSRTDCRRNPLFLSYVLSIRLDRVAST